MERKEAGVRLLKPAPWVVEAEEVLRGREGGALPGRMHQGMSGMVPRKPLRPQGAREKLGFDPGAVGAPSLASVNYGHS